MREEVNRGSSNSPKRGGGNYEDCSDNISFGGSAWRSL